jgi:hypothetical protein
MPAKRRPPPATRRRPTRASLIAKLRAICMAFPEAIEKPSHGEPTWFAGKGKVFAMLDDHHHGAQHLSVWLPQPLGRQEDLIDADPELFFRPAYVGPSGWVGVVLDRGVDWALVAKLIEDAFRKVATAKLVARLDAATGPPPPTPRKARSRPPARTGQSGRRRD